MGDPPDDALRFGRASECFAAPATHTTSHLVMRRLQSTLAHRSHPKSLPPRIFFLDTSEHDMGIATLRHTRYGSLQTTTSTGIPEQANGSPSRHRAHTHSG